jgi:hypothetical protein
MTTKQTIDQGKEMFTNWKKMMDDGMGRLKDTWAEMDRMQRQNMEQAHTAIDEFARMMKDSVSYSTKLTDEWRKVAMETTERASNMFSAIVK